MWIYSISKTFYQWVFFLLCYRYHEYDRLLRRQCGSQSHIVSLSYSCDTMWLICRLLNINITFQIPIMNVFIQCACVLYREEHWWLYWWVLLSHQWFCLSTKYSFPLSFKSAFPMNVCMKTKRSRLLINCRHWHRCENEPVLGSITIGFHYKTNDINVLCTHKYDVCSSFNQLCFKELNFCMRSG